MNKLFKHTKKLVLLAMTVVMMVSTAMVVIAAESNKAPDPKNLTILTVGTQNVDKDGNLKYDANGNKSIKKVTPTIYSNGSEFEVVLPGTGDNEALVELPNSITLDVDARIRIDKNEDGKINNADKGLGSYIDGEYTVKSSNEDVATVVSSADGETITITAGKTAGSATIKLVEKNPINPLKPQKTATIKVTVKTLVDTITFDDKVVKNVDGNYVVEAGKGGSVSLGTATNNATKKNVKYVIDKKYNSYLAVNAKGVLTAKKTTDDLEGGYVEVRVVAQDQNYTYTQTAKNGKVTTKKAVWGVNEVIRVYISEPAVKSIKVLNVPSTVNKQGVVTNELYASGTGKSAYQTLEMKTNASSNMHTYKLQTEAYSLSNWKGDLVPNAVTYTTSNAKIATVDANGVITAKANGTAKITLIPVDGVKLTKNDVFTITVKVTTDVENIEIANTNITTFTSKALTLKAKVNAGVVAKDAKVEYAIKDASSEELLAHVTAKSKNAAKGTFLSDMEGTITVVAKSVKDSTITRDIKITFVNQVTKINATVTSYNENNGKANDKAKAITLYLDRAEVKDMPANDTCDVKVAVTKKNVKDAITSVSAPEFIASSSNTAVANVVEKDGGYQIIANGKGSAKITIAAQDGSKQKAVINVTVKQKVNDITVANAVDGELYFVVNEKDNAATTVKFTATPNTDANTKALAYSFALNQASWMGEDAAKAVALKGQNLTVSKEATAGLKAYFESENAPADGRVLVGTLTVTAKDNSKDGMPVAIQHIAKDVKVNVYAVAANKYVDQIEGGLAGLVANMIEGDVLTATTGQKNINLAAMLEIPADVTVRTVKWSVPKTSNAYLSVNAKGLMTIKNKLTEAGEQAEVYVQMTGADGKLLDPVALKVRIIASQKDFDNNLKGQIDTIIKENTYTWLGGKPTFNKAKGALTVAISDITMSKEAADAEMKAKLENIMEVFKTAAEAVIANTSTEYTSLTAVDSYTGKVWALNKVGSKVIVTVDGVQQGGEYDALNVSAAIKDLAGLITADIDELVEWAGKTLNVTLVADNTRNGQSTFTYTSNFTVNFTIKAADVQKYLDYKVGKAVDTFKAANEKVKDQTGIDNVVYDAAAGTVTLDLVDGNKVLADVYNLVKADAVATLEDLFVNAKTATVKVESPLLSADDKTEETFENNGQSVAEFVEKLYAHLPEEAVTTKNLEGTSIYATIVYNFSGTEYTKSYKVSFKRTLEAIDTDVDNRINAEVEKYEANELGALVYDAEANYLTVLVRDFDATFANARNHVNAVETTINAMIGDTFAKAAKVDTVEFANKTAETIKVTATDVLDIVMPEWAFESELSDLIGIEVPVTVYYKETVDTTTKEKVYSDALYYTVKFDMDMTVAEDAIEAAVKENVNAINAAEITTESIVLGADFSVATNTAVVVLNDEYLEKAPGELQSTGLYTMLVDVLNTAKANCAETVQVVYGEEATKAESLDAEISKKFVFELLGTLNINTLADFTKAPLEVYVTFTNKNVVSYVITFEAESILGAIESNPIMIQDMMFTQEVRAGKQVYFTGRIGGMILTVTGENAYVVYEGQRYDAVDGKVSVPMADNGFFYWPAFSIGNAGDETVVYNVAITYPAGHQMNPEVIEEVDVFANYYDGSLAANNTTGYFYTHTVAETGTMDFSFAEVTEGVVGDISVQNQNTYQMFTLDADGEEDMWGNKVLTVPVTAGDVLVINVVALPDANWNWPAMDYSMAVSFAYPLGTELNPVDLGFFEVPGTQYLEVEAGETVYFQSGAIGGTIMTLHDATGSAVVTYNSETYEIEDGKIELALAQSMFRQPIVFAVQNTGAVDRTYAVSFAYPVGTQMNPVEISDITGYAGYYDGSLAEGNTSGYYYTYTAEEAGTVSFWYAECTEGVVGDISVYNQNSYQMLTLDADGVEDMFGDKILTINVAAGDVLEVSVAALPDANWNWPAMEYSMAVLFEYPEGSEQNPVDLVVSNVPGTVKLTVPAGKTVYYQSNTLGGVQMTIAEATGCAVLHAGTTYEVENGRIDLVLTKPMMFMQPVVFAIQNKTTAEATYEVAFAYQAGTVENPEAVALGTTTCTLAEGNDCYYFQYTVATSGALTIDVSATEGGWQYCINNETQGVYGDTHWYDDETVVPTETINVTTGDVIRIMVGTYETGSWTNPAGTVKFTLSLE